MVFRLLGHTAAVVPPFPYQGLQLAFFHVVPEKWWICHHFLENLIR